MEQAAAFIALQASAARGKPVAPLPGGRWSSPGYAHLSDSARQRGFTERLLPGKLAERVTAIMAIDWPRVIVIHDDADKVECQPDGRVVIDPPYAGTTGYGAQLKRARVCAIAQRHAEAGSLVGVCEAEPLNGADGPLKGWAATRLQRESSMPRAVSIEEWITTSAPPARPQVAMPW